MVTRPAQSTPTKTSGNNLADRITKPSPNIAFVAATIYGKGGVGKTTLLSTMPGRGLVIDVPQVEGGTMVLTPWADRIDVFQAIEWADLSEVFKYLRDSDHGYKWFALDTITATQELAKRKTLVERDLSADPHLVAMQDWGKIGELQKDLFYRFRTLPMHGLFLAQERLRSGEGGALEYQPDISPAAMSGLIPSMFLMGRLFTREVEDPETKNAVVERRLRVGPHAMSVTKVRALPDRQVPSVIKEPNLGKIFAWLLGSKNAKAPEGISEDDGFEAI